MRQHQKLLLGFLLGILLGLFAHSWLSIEQFPFMIKVGEGLTLIGAIFLRLIFMVVVPLILSALLLGTMELGRGAGLGKVAGRCLLFTLIFSGLAVMIAIGMTNLLHPGTGFSFDQQSLAANVSVISIEQNVSASREKAWFQYIVDLLPQNPLDAAVRAFSGEMIALMFFALFFGWALSQVITREDHPLTQMLEAIFQASMRIIEFAMKLAPYAVFSIVFNTTFKMGGGFLGNVAWYALVVILGLSIQFFVVYGFFLAAVARISPWRFFNQCRDVYLYAFSTASSNATLPIALECAHSVLRLPPRIARFVLTIGASANQNGTALFEGVTVIFLAQVFHVELSLAQQIIVVLMSVLAGVGTAGIPGGSLPLIVILMVQVGIPAEGIGLILGVDRFLDMCRTTLNVAGDLVIAQLVTATLDHKTITDLGES